MGLKKNAFFRDTVRVAVSTVEVDLDLKGLTKEAPKKGRKMASDHELIKKTVFSYLNDLDHGIQGR